MAELNGRNAIPDDTTARPGTGGFLATEQCCTCPAAFRHCRAMARDAHHHLVFFRATSKNCSCSCIYALINTSSACRVFNIAASSLSYSVLSLSLHSYTNMSLLMANVFNTMNVDSIRSPLLC